MLSIPDLSSESPSLTAAFICSSGVGTRKKGLTRDMGEKMGEKTGEERCEGERETA
jgi:hypothetical protein